MEPGEYIAELAAAGRTLAGAAERAGLDAPVPTCPEWRVRELVTHIGGVHRWATAHVAEGRTEEMGDAEMRRLFDGAPGDTALLDWYRAGYAALVTALQEAPDDLECWTFLSAPSPRAFWARRQAHETTIHRVDAQRAVGDDMSPPAVESPAAELAADGIDELLTCFLTRPGGRLRADPPRTLAVHTTDTVEDWLVRIEPDRVATIREPGTADCTLSGTAARLYLLLWNRADLGDVRLDGDATVLDLWRTRALIRLR